MLGDKIKLLRKELNISQEKLAEKLNVSPSTIAMYETNKRQPNYEILLKLSDIFNCTLDYLMCKTDKKNSDDMVFDPDLIKIGLSSKDYNPPTEKQRKQIEEFAKFVLQDNKKNKKDI